MYRRRRIELRREYKIRRMAQALCVFCRKHLVDLAWRPFCSERCKLQDLAKWAEGTYTVAGEPARDPDENEQGSGLKPHDE
jgi:endogenous inhibitor of DNA gyrase (YacG/DUF329 family)